jgi:Protein of unknown function (DUF1499)
MGISTILIVIAAVVLSMIFVPFVRSVVSIMLRIAIFLGAVFVAVAGVAILANNETIYARPGWKPRVSRFLTVDWANTSEKGLGDAPCMTDRHGAEPKAAAHPEPKRGAGKNKQETAQAAPAPTATPTPAPGETEEENVYDELVTRNYICPEGDPIPRGKLFQMAQDTVNELSGWKLMSSDQRSATLNCTYTTRVFGFEDDVKIVITPKTDLEICSQSRAGAPDSASLLRFFHGDFGANIGHIKQFYAAFQPKADQYCKQLEQRQKAKPTPQ